MPDASLPETTTLPPPEAAPAAPAPRPRTARARSAPAKPRRAAAKKPAKSSKPAKAAKAAPNLVQAARRLETDWDAALQAHARRVRRDFATLHRKLAGRKADAKLERLLGRKPKARGRLKDLRKAERALRDALDRVQG
jgi:hypothetical protein